MAEAAIDQVARDSAAKSLARQATFEQVSAERFVNIIGRLDRCEKSIERLSNILEEVRRSLLTREEVQSLLAVSSKAAGQQTIDALFSMLGVNGSNVDALQKFRDNLSFLRDFHDGYDENRRKDDSFVREARMAYGWAIGRVGKSLFMVAMSIIVVAMGIYIAKTFLGVGPI